MATTVEPVYIKETPQCATGHWSQYQFITKPLRLSPYQPSSNWSYKTYKLSSPKGRESTGM